MMDNEQPATTLSAAEIEHARRFIATFMEHDHYPQPVFFMARLLATLDHERIQTDALLEHLQDEEARSRAAYQAKLDAYRTALSRVVAAVNAFRPCPACSVIYGPHDANCALAAARAVLEA